MELQIQIACKSSQVLVGAVLRRWAPEWECQEDQMVGESGVSVALGTPPKGENDLHPGPYLQTAAQRKRSILGRAGQGASEGP